MWGQPKQASSATMAIIYITLGALTDVWTIIYYVYARRQNYDENTFLWIYGFFASGVVLMVIGFALGRIGRSAKQAEVTTPPHTVVTQTSVPTAASAPAVTDAANRAANQAAMAPAPPPASPTTITAAPPQAPTARRV